MGGMREGLQGAFWVAKDGIVKSLSVFLFISVYHEVFCWPMKMTTCPFLTSPRPFLFRPTWGCSIMSYQQAFFSQVWVSLLWVEVMLGEKGCKNGSGNHNWSWEISFLTKKILVCNKSTGDVCSYDRVRRDCQETKPEGFDIFLLSFAATAVWREQGVKKKGVVRLGENSKSTAVASQLKILRVWRWNMLSPGSLNAVCSISLMAALPRSQTHVLSLQPAFCLQALLSVRGKRCPFTAGWPYKD